jgi:hypothetical protein
VKQRCGSASADPDLTYHCDADLDPDFYLMRIRIRLVTMMWIRIQVPKIMQIRMRIRIHYTERGHCIIQSKDLPTFGLYIEGDIWVSHREPSFCALVAIHIAAGGGGGYI